MTQSKENGEMAEEWASRMFEGRDVLPQPLGGRIDFLVDGLFVEVKSCYRFISHSCNARKRRGQFILNPDQHKILLKHGGVYLFIVHEGDFSTADFLIRKASDVRYKRKINWIRIFEENGEDGDHVADR